jgi:folate-binding Fe-S cluster repair protein YgfZ
MLRRHVLRSKVRIRDASDEYDVWAAWGSDAKADNSRRWVRAPSGALEPVWDSWPWGLEGEALLDRRADGMGSRRLVRKGDRREQCTVSPSAGQRLMRVAQEISTHDEGQPDDYLLHRITHGVPEGAVDVPPMQAFPMESNLDVMGACESDS